ncbi:hypothetical protein MLD38_008221 [Melastoma candidum]|uniref:Uncharacterized protein n=1 Tax=Melastoma candidum TaxID=119954 RepID=A0ACB9RUV8_9MYRT|nr:hypothetical protein MLD38_008221 [Melastoma candidum]
MKRSKISTTTSYLSPVRPIEKYGGFSAQADADPRFPGFKFSPADEELITYYLRKKLAIRVSRSSLKSKSAATSPGTCPTIDSQDSPVVCQVRRNTEFRSGDGMSRASMSQGPPLIAGRENRSASEGDVEILANVGDAIVTATSNNGSYSINSMWESNQKLMNDAVMTEPSTHPKDKEDTSYYNDVDDYLAYFLNDDRSVIKESAEDDVVRVMAFSFGADYPFAREAKYGNLINHLKQQLRHCRSDATRNDTVVSLTEHAIEAES